MAHIGESAFQGESAFRLKVSLPNMSHRCTRLRFCGEHFFGWVCDSSCTSLASISLGASVAHIGESAFQGESAFHLKVFLPNMSHRCTRLRFCDEHFFGWVCDSSCTSLASISLGASVAHIGESAFQDCDSLAGISLGEFVAHIGESAFEDCTSLASISLGASVLLILGRVPFKTAILWWAFLWVSLWLTLGRVPLKTAPLWRALVLVHLWLILGWVPFKTAILWRAFLWVSLWLTLGRVPLKTAPLWRASQFRSHWVNFAECIVEPVCVSHHFRKERQETTTRAVRVYVTECADLFWCHWPKDWYNLRKMFFVALWWVKGLSLTLCILY